MPDLLAIDSLRAGYGEAVVLPSMSLTLADDQAIRDVVAYITTLTPAN